MLVDQTLGIALVDDDPPVLDMVGAMLAAKTKFVVFKASDGDGLISLLGRERIDCIVLDYNLGEDNGFAVMQRANERFPTVPPVVMLTGNGSEATIVKAMRLGIDDYVIKRTMTSGELIAAIVRTVESDRKESAAKAEFERLKGETAIDLATGMLAKAELQDRLAALVSLTPETRAQYGLILAQLTNLTDIREKFGLGAGELALREFASHVRRAIRSNDICGRLGDDALLIIANVSGDRAVMTAICERLAAQVVGRLDIDIGSAQLSARFGAALRPAGADGPVIKRDDLLEPARNALKIAADQGLVWALLPPTPPIHTGAPTVVASEATAENAKFRPAAEALRTVDRRREWRQRVFKRGQILVPGKDISINCMVRNLSTHGAGLRIEAVFPVPESFELAIYGSSERRKAEVRWQTGVDLGVEFVDIP